MPVGRISRFKKNKKAILILASTVVGLAFFSISVGSSLTVKYNGKHPRYEVMQLAKKVSFVSFNPEKISEKSNFFEIKEKLFLGDKVKKEIDLKEYLIVYLTENNSNDLVQFSTNSNSFAPEFEFVDLSFNDLNQNFIVKFRVRQKLKNNQFAYSDFLLQSISFYESNKFLKANFNFALQKILKTINEGALNFDTLISNFSDQKQQSFPKSLYRTADFAEKINISQTPQEAEIKISEILPQLSNLIYQVRKSIDNKIPKTDNPIFDFQFIRNKINQNFVSVQNDIATVFLEAKLSAPATKILANFGQSFSTKIFEINLETKRKKSIFFNVENFFQKIELKPLKFNNDNKNEKLIINDQNPFDFFTKIKYEFFPGQSNPDYLKKLINSLLTEDLALDFGNFTKLIPENQTGISFEFDQKNARLKNENGNYIIEIPYKVMLNESLFKKDSQKILYEKDLILKISGFGQFNKTGKDQITNFANLTIPGKQKALIYSQNPFFGDETNNKSEFITTFGQLIVAENPLKKQEIDSLLVQQDYKSLQKKLNLEYNYNFENFEAKIRSWTGKISLPNLDQIARFARSQQTLDINSKEPDKKLEVSSLFSQGFFKNPSDVATFFAELIQKKPNEIANAFFQIAKAFGLLNQNRESLQIFNKNDSKNIFEIADKINLDNKKINVLSFNNHFSDIFNQGFFSTLFLPKSIKEKFTNLNDKTIYSVINILKDEQIFSQTKQNFTKQQIENSIKSSSNFSTLADVLLAFYFKAAQLDNFLAWTKLDSNLDYQIVFRKGTEISKTRLDLETKKINQQKNKSELQQSNDANLSIVNQSESQNQKSEVSSEYLTLNFYYIIGDSSTKNFFLQSPVQKILINFSNKLSDQYASLQTKLDKIIENIPPELLNFQVSDQDYTEIKNKLENKTPLANSEVWQNKNASSYFKENSENIAKIREYFKTEFKDSDYKFFFEPSFENSLITNKLTFFINFSFSKPKESSEISNQAKTETENKQSQQNTFLAKRKLKITVTKKS